MHIIRNVAAEVLKLSAYSLIIVRFLRVKGKGQPRTGQEEPEGEYSYSSTVFLISALEGGVWSTVRLGRSTHKKDPVSIVNEVGWAPGPV